MHGGPLAIDATENEKTHHSRKRSCAQKLERRRLRKAKDYLVLMTGSVISVGMSIGLDVVPATCVMLRSLAKLKSEQAMGVATTKEVLLSTSKGTIQKMNTMSLAVRKKRKRAMVTRNQKVEKRARLKMKRRRRRRMKKRMMMVICPSMISVTGVHRVHPPVKLRGKKRLRRKIL